MSHQFKYLLYPEHGYEELYDTKNDPHETNNLAKDPKYREVLTKMRKRYKELKKEVL